MTGPQIPIVERGRAAARRLRRRFQTQEQIWERALPTEVAFWDKVLETKGLDWPWAYERGLDPDAPVLDDLIKDRLDALAQEVVTLIDVGAGPLSSAGKTHPGKRLEITATDPLADAYDELLARHGVEPPLRTQRCRGEDLLTTFGPDRFDLAYARNSVDHSADPLTIIENMLAVTRPGGHVLLRHYRNEAELEHYEELHQWNFDVAEGGRLLLWNQRARHDVGEALAGRALVEAAIEGGSDHGDFVAAKIAKL